MDHKLEARVKQDYNLGSVQAFSGLEFSRTEWRPVPAGFEEQAKNHPLLDVREIKTGSVKAVPASRNIGLEEMPESFEETTTRRGRKPKEG